MNYKINAIKPRAKEQEYGFQINSVKPCWSFFFWLDFTKRRYKYPRPIFEYSKCDFYGLHIKAGKLHIQFTNYTEAV